MKTPLLMNRKIPLVCAVALLFTSGPPDFKLFFQSCTQEQFARVFVYRDEGDEADKARPPNRVRPVFTASTTFIEATGRGQDASLEEGSAARGKAIYEEKCASCHSIGGGPELGPDLQGVTQQRSTPWLIEFIMNPEEMFADDPLARQLLEEWQIRMPDMDVEYEQAVDLLAYIQTASETAPSEAEPAIAAPAMPAGRKAREERVMEGSYEEGLLYYTGDKELKNEGPSCLGCHNLPSLSFPYGGLLGPELSGVYQRLGPDRLYSALDMMPWKVMRSIYREKPLTDSEIQDLIALLQGTAEKPNPPDVSLLLALPIAGGGFLLSLALAWAIWRSRITTVRQALVNRATQAGGTTA
ncbi:MAG: hypothetical protein C4520_00575 [Candidatus Abyssobacteria bacterium SURF_5]|uniref:Cytochrome c domain-containing protein n=1 Tax=Abyssobacteria bacterium (strain SURF_5) TaxID=2093360 RepID=A0A3A4PEU1_ABYX5|nr:MAG: hypothetical protein C4520_00575 [Candidatus Abyssubacteria bacterium SURF_5]